MDFQKGGLRVIPVSIELLTDLLHGRLGPAIPENVPADMIIIGSISKEDLFRITPPMAPYPPTQVLLLCQSQEWPVGEDIDRATNDIRIFEPTYRRKEVA